MASLTPGGRPVCGAQQRQHRSSRRSSVQVHARQASRSSVSMREMASQVKSMRSKAEEDEQLSVLMAGLRGTNMDDSDFQRGDVTMNLVEVQITEDETDRLPQVYDPEAIRAFWERRPVSVVTRITQLLGTAGGFLSRLLLDFLRGRLKETEVARAVELRNIMTTLGPAYIKLGQALSIRPDLLSPAAMVELQKLCDKVPSFPTPIAMQVLQDELGAPWPEIYSELTPEPIAAASLGQVYKGRIKKTGEVVAVKVQRPGVLETVTIDLFIIRSLGMAIRQWAPEVTKRADVVALLDEWASRFFEELDYVQEGRNATKFAEQMRVDLPQVVVPATYTEYTSRRVLTTEWLEGEKLSQSQASDVGTLVNVGVICYLKQLLETGFFHADPHPGNLIRTPDGRLAILDFGLMTQVDDNIKFGMIEAVSHLIHRDYEAIVEDFVTLDFIPRDTDLRPIQPVLARVFDAALEGGGAKSINFQELAADLAQITFDYPFRIPPYFALIIRAIGVLEGIALVGNPQFAIVDEAYPYIARRLLTDPSPRLREALRYMVYGRSNVFDADRVIDLLSALEEFQVASTSAMGDTTLTPNPPGTVAFSSPPPNSNGTQPSTSSNSSNNGWSLLPQLPLPLPPFPFPPAGFPFPLPGAGGSAGGFRGQVPAAAAAMLDPFGAGSSPVGQLLLGALSGAATWPAGQANGSGPAAGLMGALSPGFGTAAVAGGGASSSTREALRFMLSPEGVWFREFVMDELVRSVDALSRDQAHALAMQLGLASLNLPVLLPGSRKQWLPLAPPVSEEDRRVVENIAKIIAFLSRQPSTQQQQRYPGAEAAWVADLLPVLPVVAQEMLPELTQRLASRVTARLVRELYA